MPADRLVPVPEELTTEQAADALGISVRTANRDWAYAKAWLFQRLSG